MRTAFSQIFLIAVAGLSIACGGMASTSAQRTISPTGGSSGSAQAILGFDSIFFANDKTGWVGGQLTSQQGVILGTNDGGKTWQQQYVGSARTISQIDFVSPLVGWASSADDLLRTTDGGRTWNVLPKTASTFVELDFFDPSLGWAITTEAHDRWPWGDGILSKTLDAGRTWTSVPVPASAQSACVVSPTELWVASHTAILHSVDGGLSWSTAFTATVGGQGWTAVIRCARPGVVWVEFYAGVGAAQQEPFIIYRSLDRGGHWDAIMSENYFPAYTPAPRNVCCYAGPFTGLSISNMTLTDTRTVFISTYCPACEGSGATSLLRSSDGGSTWNSKDLPVPEKSVPFVAGGVQFLNSDRGRVIGTRPFTSPDKGVVAEEKQIYTTSKGGNSWKKLYP